MRYEICFNDWDFNCMYVWIQTCEKAENVTNSAADDFRLFGSGRFLDNYGGIIDG